MRRVSKEMTDRARRLRNEATPAERIIWRRLSNYRPSFTGQLVVGSYIVDLACREAKLAIEFDGSQHLEQQNYDDRRTKFLESEGWRVMRIWNNDALANPEGVARLILEEAAECLGGTHPQPLPSKEGRIRRPRYE